MTSGTRRTRLSRQIHRLEPVVWTLFVSSTFVSALFLPSFLFVLTIADPLGWTPDGALEYQRARGLAIHPMGRALLFALVVTCLWNGAHHLRHFVVALRGPRRDAATAAVLYAGACAGSLLALVAVFAP